MMFTFEDFVEHEKRNEELSAFLEKKGREFDALTERKLPTATHSNLSLESWDVWDGYLSLTYYETWRYGGQEWYTIKLPAEALTMDVSVAAEEANRKAKEAAEEKKLREEVDAKAARRKQFEKLKEEFGD